MQMGTCIPWDTPCGWDIYIYIPTMDFVCQANSQPQGNKQSHANATARNVVEWTFGIFQ
jgi:hypothetical protein